MKYGKLYINVTPFDEPITIRCHESYLVQYEIKMLVPVGIYQNHKFNEWEALKYISERINRKLGEPKLQKVSKEN